MAAQQQAWVQASNLDVETVALLGFVLRPNLEKLKIKDRRTIFAVIVEAAELFHELHQSNDPLYWDTRNWEIAVCSFAGYVGDLLETVPWNGFSFAMEKETLRALIARVDPNLLTTPRY